MDLFKQYAIDNIWCNPYQDRQAIITLSRFSSPSGVYLTTRFMENNLPLPDNSDYYHLYGIGANLPERLNVPMEINRWYTLSEVMDNRAIIIDIYTDEGVMLPRSQVYIRRTTELFYVIAHKTSLNVSDKVITIRFYSNAFFYTGEGIDYSTKIHSESIVVNSTEDAFDLQSRYQQYSNRPIGDTIMFHNGYIVDNIIPNQVELGDTIDWIYDASIERTLEFKLSDLLTFESALDAKMKFLIHPPKGNDKIDYADDVDFFIYQKEGSKYKGIYYHKNRIDSIRMVTHNDYSLVSGYVAQFIDSEVNDIFTNPNDVYIKLIIRKSGYNRELVFESNRIHELYKLSDDNIVRAMIGVDSTIPNWTAASLEKSAYAAIMRAFYPQIDNELSMEALGYNAMSVIVGDQPIRINNDHFDVPYAFVENSTVYEYDHEGILLAVEPHSGGYRYYPSNVNTAIVEYVAGSSSPDSGPLYGNVDVLLNPNFEYRMYVSRVVSGVLLNEWVDVTGDSEAYEIINNVLKWKIPNDTRRGAVVSNEKFIRYELVYNEMEMINFTINESSDPSIPKIAYIPRNKLDLFLNNRPIIYGIDYFGEYPTYQLNNKEFLNQEGPQVLHVRMHGLADESKISYPSETGFVKHDLISLNHIFNVRDDKVIRIIGDGRLLLRDQLDFAENPHVIQQDELANGRPYSIDGLVPPIRGLVPFNNHPGIEYAIKMDKRVSDYLTMKIPEPVFPGPPLIPVKYRIFSPYCAKIIKDLQTGILTPLLGAYSDYDLQQHLIDYESFLTYDPCRQDLNSNFISIHPTPYNVTTSLTQAQYGFVNRMIKVQLWDKVNLSHFIDIVG